MRNINIEEFKKIYDKYMFFHYDDEMLSFWRFRYMCNKGTMIHKFLSEVIYKKYDHEKPKQRTLHTKMTMYYVCGDYYKRMKHIYGGWFFYW